MAIYMLEVENAFTMFFKVIDPTTCSHRSLSLSLSLNAGLRAVFPFSNTITDQQKVPQTGQHL